MDCYDVVPYGYLKFTSYYFYLLPYVASLICLHSSLLEPAAANVYKSMYKKTRRQMMLQTFTQHFFQYSGPIIMKCFEDSESDFLI